MKKYKQLFIGFLMGAVLFGAMPVQAKVQEYLLQKSTAKLMVDGKEFSNTELPVLNYKGYNYIPAATFREVCTTIGVGFEWVGEKNEIQINTKMPASTPILENKKEDAKNGIVTNIVKDGFDLAVMDGTEYITAREIHEYLIDNKLNYRIEYLQENNTFRVYSIDFKDTSKSTTVLDNIPVSTIAEGISYIDYKYFKNNILPLIK